MIEIRKVIANPEYDFLETNEHLRNKMLFLTFGGSHAYGTNVTIWENGQYTAYQVEQRIETAIDIFGERAGQAP